MSALPHLGLIIFVLGYVTSEDATPKPDRTDFKKSLSRNCENAYTMTCLKLDVVSWVDKLNEQDNFSVFPGISFVRENGSARANTAELVAELAREFPNNAETRLDAYLTQRVSSYLKSHSLTLKLFDKDAYAATELHGTGRGKGKGGGGGLGALLALGALFKGILGAAALAGIAALAAKALGAAMMAMMLAAIAGLKSGGGGGGKTTYEIVSKPVYSHSNTHSTSEEHGGHGGGHGGWERRSYEMPLPLGLQPNYKP